MTVKLVNDLDALPYLWCSLRIENLDYWSNCKVCKLKTLPPHVQVEYKGECV